MSQSRVTKVLALSLGQGLTTVVILLVGMVLSRLLTKVDLATYRQTFLAYNVVAPFLSLGLSSGLYYFLPDEKKRVRGVVVDGLLLMVVMGMVYAIFIACGGNYLLAKRFSNPEVVQTLLYLIPYPLITLPAGLLGAVLVVRGKISQLSIFNVLSNLLLGGSILGACLVWRTTQGIIIINVAVSMVIGIVAITLMLKAVPRDDWRPNWNNIKFMTSYSFPLALATMLGSIALQLDKIIVSSMCSPEDFAVYSNGAIEIPLIGVVTGSISTVILADMAAYCKRGEKAQALVLFKKGAVRSALILLPAMAFLMVYSKEFITILFTEKYLGSVNVFRIYLGILPIRIVMYGPALMALNMTRVILLRSLCDLLLNMVLSCIFVYFWGPYGAAIATVLTLFIWTVPFNLAMIARGFCCRWYEILPLQIIGKIFCICFVSAILSFAISSVSVQSA